MKKRIPLLDSNTLETAVEIIQKGGIIVYPTDTLYGLGVDATNGKAISKLNQLKNRTGPISIIVANKTKALSMVDLSMEDKALAEKVIGGKTTLIAKVSPHIVHPMILGNGQTLGIRIPDHPFGCNLTERLGFPITTTSVNRRSQPPLNNPDDIEKIFGDKIDLIIDDGVLPKSSGSEIFKIENHTLIQLR